MSKSQELIEQNEKPSSIAFIGEVESLEFTEAVGNIKNSYSTNPKKRDKKLKSIGKKMFRKHPYKKRTNFGISIRKTTRLLSQDEIDDLLTGNKRKVKFYERELVIYFMGKSYTFDFLIKLLTNKDFRNKNIDNLSGSLSQDEIDYLLEEIRKSV